MRCKNCGSQNDDNLYICQNCGSPLYDEEEPLKNEGDGTRVFATLDDPNNTQNPIDAAAQRAAVRQAEEEERKKKQQITVIVVLAILLIAIITGTILAVAHGKNTDPETTSDLSVSESLTETTDQSTTRERTTKATTESTTKETTTETTTEAVKYYTVSISSNDGGTVDGGGSYELGDNATVTASADSGYEFDGWYQNGSKISGSAVYTFTVTDNTKLKAVFKIVAVEPDTEGGIEIIDGEDIN